MANLKGKTVIVTGGGRAVLENGKCGSIGYGIATAFAKEGANLVLTGRNLQKLLDAKEELERLYNAYEAKSLQNMALLVDANHSNSAKKYQEQPRICKEVLHSCRHSACIKSMVKGFMIESYLEGGSQKIGEGVYGKSITDPCIGWADTERLVQDIAELI